MNTRSDYFTFFSTVFKLYQEEQVIVEALGDEVHFIYRMNLICLQKDSNLLPHDPEVELELRILTDASWFVSHETRARLEPTAVRWQAI